MSSLRGVASICQPRQKIIVSQDKGNPRVSHRAINENRNLVTQYQIDGAVIKTGLRCDFLVTNEERKTAYLIELKGSDIDHAIDQLEATAQELKKELSSYSLNFRIVCTRDIMGPNSYKYKKFKSKYNGRVDKKERVIKEKIS